MSIRETLHVGTVATLAFALVACGGSSSGGNGGGTMGGSQGYNLQAGIANMVTHGLTANVSLSGTVVVNGTSVPVTGSGTFTLTAGVSGTFNGNAANSQMQTLTGTVTAAGQSQSVSQSVTDYYASSSSDFLGEVASTEYDVAQAPFQYPTSVEGSTSGTLGTVLRYKDSTMSVSLGTAQTTYTTTAPAMQGGSLSITITTKVYDTTNTLVATDVTNYTMTTSNVISFASASAQTQQGTLTATAQ